jgi:hypothetical protein
MARRGLYPWWGMAFKLWRLNRISHTAAMIVFNLSCDKAHRFEGWFGSADDFASQAESGNIACPVCGSVDIEKMLSAPYINTRATTAADAHAAESKSVTVANSAQLLRQKFVEQVLQSTENVGRRFPEEARRIFYKEIPERAIRGTATGKEVAELKEEGIDILSVPDLAGAPDKLH